MTQKQFLARVFADSNKQVGSGGLTKRQVEIVARSVFDQMAEALREEGNFARAGFGTFKVRERAARTGRNPRTGEAIDIPASKTIGFKAGAALRKAATS